MSEEFAEGQPQPSPVCEVNVAKGGALQATNKRSSLPTKGVFFSFFFFFSNFSLFFLVLFSPFLLKDNPAPFLFFYVFFYFLFFLILLNVTQPNKRWW